MVKTIAKTENITIQRRTVFYDKYYVVIWNKSGGWNKFYTRDKAFQFAYILIRHNGR